MQTHRTCDIGCELKHWQSAPAARLVDTLPRHSIHSYFNACPESPDGRWVLFFCSTTPDAHEGSVVVRDRQSSECRVVAHGVVVEDAHRQAYQQWCDHGRRIVYQNLCGRTWHIHAYDMATGLTQLLTEGRQLGWGQPVGCHVPIYGPHWSPGEHRDLQLLDVASGRVDTPATVTDIFDQSPHWVRQTFDRSLVSVFFPVLSPDGKRLFFKLSQPDDGQFRSRHASKRKGLLVYDLDVGRLLCVSEHWGHPSWHPDSQTIITTPNVLIDANTGSERRLSRLPDWPGSHPGFHPSGRLVLSDTYLRGPDVPRGWWAVAVGDPETGEVCHVHELRELPGGATSWRPPHPHPTFSRDGRRIYFNVSAGQWTRLHVVEI